MKVTQGYPPNIAKIKEALRPGPNTVFTYGDTLYVPGGGIVMSNLFAHEEVHSKNQSVLGVEAWWDKYLVDAKFRLDEELEAYRAQYQYAKENMNRHDRRMLLSLISKDLASPMYGSVISEEQAKIMIQTNG